jgi:hypothetical protein
MVYEYDNAYIDDIRNNQKIEIKKGKNYDDFQDEWENKRVIDYNENLEKVDNIGKNIVGEWKEEWVEKGKEKWAKKEGQNYLNKDQWREEWYEK